MQKWPDDRIQKLLGIEVPIIQAPMAGAAFAELAIAVANSGGLGSLACASLSLDQIKQQVTQIRAQTSGPLNLNFFSHKKPMFDAERDALWRKVLEDYFLELGMDAFAPSQASGRAPFDSSQCEIVEAFKPEIVSFHFGLPELSLLNRVKATGAKVLSSATTVDEARWLEERGCDAIIAQGFEAGGHRAMFLTDDISTQVGTFSLVPQIADAVKVPVIASGGIADGRAIVAAFALGASGVQIGTAYLLCPEAKISAVHSELIRNAKDDSTVLTNVFTGRPARGFINRLVREIGPMSAAVPAFPLASSALEPLRTKLWTPKSADFAPMWSGQSAHLARELPAESVTRYLADEAVRIWQKMAPPRA